MPTSQTYSIYWNGLGVPSFEIEVGFDAGKIADAIRIDYVGSDTTKDDVIIHTIGGTLVLNNENDDITHYGTADAVYKRLVGENKYHFGEGATIHAIVNPKMIHGAKFAGTGNKTATTRASLEKNVYLKAGTIIALINEDYNFNVVKASSEDYYNTGASTVAGSYFLGGQSTWYPYYINKRVFKVPSDGYYGFQFQNRSGSGDVNLAAFHFEDVIKLTYRPEVYIINEGTAQIISGARVSSISTYAKDRFSGFFSLELVQENFLPSSSQDGYIYDGKAYISNSYTNQINILSLIDGSNLGSMSYDEWSTNKVHGNAVHLRKYNNQYYTYSNIYNSYQNNENKRFGECCVYLTDLTNSTENPLELTQIIKIGFVDDEAKWPRWNASSDRPYGNFLIDEDNNLLYVYVMDINTNTTKWFKFDLPSPTDSNEEGNVYSLSYESVLDSWETPYMNMMQGATIINGLIYSTEGPSGNPGIRVIDPVLKAELLYIDSSKLDANKSEPEFIAYYNGYLYYGSGNNNNLYKLYI